MTRRSSARPRKTGATVALATTMLVSLVACDEAPLDSIYCVRYDGTCYRTEETDCDDDTLVSSCGAVDVFIVCSGDASSCSCVQAYDDEQPSSIECNTSRFNEPAKCCAKGGYPSLPGGQCYCLAGNLPLDTDCSVIDDCALAGAQ